MNTSKKINVNFSSLVGLKAELLRKQTEIKDAKTKEDIQPKIFKPTSKTKTKKVREKKSKKEGDYTELEDVATLKKSKIMLEAKTMLYDKLKKNRGDENHTYLVDFANKEDESEDEIHREEDYEDANSDPEDDWVEYQDCFGRSRKCLRRDLPRMREKDNLVKREMAKEPLQDDVRMEDTPPTPQIPLVEKEPEIEIMRKKWEEQMARLADKSDIHYQDVLFDEARTHGVGYYAFSQNEEERAKQQAELAKLRKETEQRQKESQEIRDLKSKMEFNRLKSAMIRKRVRSGLSAELTAEEEEALRAQVKSRHSNETQEEETSPEALEAAANRVKLQETSANNSLIVVEDKIKAFGELLGKRPKWHEMSQEEWVYKRRKDRLGEFAPVYENFRRGNYLEGSRDTRITTRDEDDDKDPVRINSTGPEPTDVWETQGPLYQDDTIEKEEQENRKFEAMKKNQSIVQQTSVSSVEPVKIDENDSDEEVIGPMPPPGTPGTFINSFVPQPMPTTPGMPVSFDRMVPPPGTINFSIPPPTIFPPVAKNPLTDHTTSNSSAIHEEDSTDSDDSIIGPVPPPSINDISSLQVENCGPRLIDNNHINILSDIPLPATVQFPPTLDYTTQSTQPLQNTKNQMGNTCEANSSGNLNIDKISAGLKYLRQKFDDTENS
ncbi:coiled-coil domain-containing protein 174 [Venturia canescens]|uniref:coiled-coil domain-containing protein 174 n=1 Tax=Venturia canescens TaxID=32260 RepID=UPI001C9C84AD|nr:coiled-coil domain-containing protein 174 [Venturia canescens]